MNNCKFYSYDRQSLGLGFKENLRDKSLLRRMKRQIQIANEHSAIYITEYQSEMEN